MPPDGCAEAASGGARCVRVGARSAARSRRGAASGSGRAGAASPESRRIRQRRFAICWRSTSTSARCCRPMIPRRASTTTPTCSACRRRSSKATRRRRQRSAAWRWRSVDRPRSRRRIACPAIWRRTSHIDGLPLGTRGGLVVHHTFPLDAEYDLEVGAGGGPGLGAARGAGPRGGGPPPPDDRYVTLDGERGDARSTRGRHGSGLPAGPHTIARRVDRRARTWSAPTASSTRRSAHARRLAGHDRRAVQSDRPRRHAEPATAADLPPVSGRRTRAARRRFSTTLASRAYRRPVARSRSGDGRCSPVLPHRAATQGDVRVGHAARGRARARRSAVPVPLRARARRRRAGRAVQAERLELASRLSFFLWSSIPDEELLARRAARRAAAPAVLERQVRRMLADPRAEALVDELRRAVAAAARSARTSGPIRRLGTATCASRSSAKPRCSSAPSSGRSQRHRSAGCGLHVRRRAAGAALRHPRRAWIAHAARHARRQTIRAAGCSARAAS